jgi:hypothetical protein
MDLTKQDIRNLARTINLDIPEKDLNTVALRLSGLLTPMEEIEAELGEEMNGVDPIPPVFPREDF